MQIYNKLEVNNRDNARKTNKKFSCCFRAWCCTTDINRSFAIDSLLDQALYVLNIFYCFFNKYGLSAILHALKITEGSQHLVINIIWLTTCYIIVLSGHVSTVIFVCWGSFVYSKDILQSSLYVSIYLLQERSINLISTLSDLLFL